MGCPASRAIAVFAAALAGAPVALAGDRNISIVAADGVRLEATFSTPRGSGPFPAVAILAGFGPDRRDGDFQGFLYRNWSNALVSRGIAVLRYDKRGMGSSGGEALSWLNPLLMRSDAIAATRSLARLRGVDARRIGLVGHSQGGDLALAVAARVPAVDNVVTLAAPGRPLGAFTTKNGLRNLEMLVGRPAAQALVRLSPLDDARRVKQPLLVVHGTADQVIPFSDSERIVAARRPGRLPTALVRLPGFGHQLTAPSTRRPPTFLVARVAEALKR